MVSKGNVFYFLLSYILSHRYQSDIALDINIYTVNSRNSFLSLGIICESLANGTNLGNEMILKTHRYLPLFLSSYYVFAIESNWVSSRKLLSLPVQIIFPQAHPTSSPDKLDMSGFQWRT